MGVVNQRCRQSDLNGDKAFEFCVTKNEEECEVRASSVGGFGCLLEKKGGHGHGRIEA